MITFACMFWKTLLLDKVLFLEEKFNCTKKAHFLKTKLRLLILKCKLQKALSFSINGKSFNDSKIKLTAVGRLKLQLLTSKYGTMRMNEQREECKSRSALKVQDSCRNT